GEAWWREEWWWHERGREGARPPPPAVTVHARRRKGAINVMEPVYSDADLLEVIATLHPRGSLAHFLHRWQQQPDQHGNNRDDDQQLDERERRPTFYRRVH